VFCFNLHLIIKSIVPYLTFVMSSCCKDGFHISIDMLYYVPSMTLSGSSSSAGDLLDDDPSNHRRPAVRPGRIALPPYGVASKSYTGT